MDPVSPLFEQIDCWGAKKTEIFSVYDVFQSSVTARKQKDELQLVPSVFLYRRTEAFDIKKQKTLWKCKVLLKESIALEAAQVDGKQCLFVAVANRLYVAGRQKLMPRPRLAGWGNGHPQRGAKT
jgi:hypothetical protein